MTFVKAVLFLALLLAFGLSPTHLLAQRTTATLFGNVTDSSGAVVAHASVAITNVETNVSYSGTTNDAGEYRFDLVPVGTYSVAVTSNNFKKYIQSAVPLSVNQEQRLDVMLSAGAAEETITVSADPPQLDLESATVERTLEAHEVENLPILDRDIYNLLNLVPGVQNNQVQGNTLGFNQQVLQLNGGTTADNTGTVSYYLDGGLNMTALRMTGNDMPNPEAIAEFNVQSSNYDATYGRMSSGVVTALTKSGANSFHGSAYEFNRNTDFDASNPINVGGGVGIVHRNMFGVTAGGPIRRDRTFFFGEYGGVRQIKPYTLAGATLPTTAEMQGNFSAYLPAGATASSKCGGTATSFVVCSPFTKKPYLNAAGKPTNIVTDAEDATAKNVLAYVSLFNNGTLNGYPTYNGQISQPYQTDEYLMKVDHQLGSKHRLTASYFYIVGDRTIPSGSTVSLPWVNQTQHWTQNLANASDTYTINDKTVNQFYLNFSRLIGSRANTVNANMAATSSSNPLNTGRESLSAFGSNIAVQGPASLAQLAISGRFTLGNAIDGPVAGTDFYSARDLFVWNKGKHSLTLGGEFSLNKDDQITDLNNYGVFTFSSSTSARTGNAMSDFYLGLPGTQTQDEPVDAIDNSFFYSLFVQDNWRIRPNLTLNLGVRWDVQTAPTDPQNKEATFQTGGQTSYNSSLPVSTLNPNMPAGMLVAGDPSVPRGTIANSFAHFSPRLGLAWDPFGKGRTSVRASAGIFWGGISGNEWNASSNYYPFSLRYTFATQGSVTNPYCAPTAAAAACTTSDSPFPFSYTKGAVNPIPSNGTIEGAMPNFVWPSTYQLTSSLQQQVTRRMAFGLAYVGSMSRHLPMSIDYNYPVFNTTTPTANSSSTVLARRPFYSATPVNSAGKATQLLGVVYGVSSNQTSNYNALQATFSQQVAKGVSFNGFYTFSKNLDSGVLNSSTPSSSSGEEDYANPKFDRGLDDYDTRNVFGMSIVWEPKYFHDGNRVVAATLDGWHISSVISLHSGMPFNITTGSDNNQDGNTTDRPTLVAGANPMVTGNSRNSRSALAKEYFNPSFWTASTTVAEPTGTVFCGYSTSAPSGCPGIGPGGSDGALRRDAYYGPGYRDVDLSLFRDFQIYESMKLQARAEASNALNMVNLGQPAANLSSAAAGTITAQQGNMREIQLGLRLTF
jgi:hypothetical protein